LRRDLRQERVARNKEKLSRLLARGYTYERAGRALGIGARQVQKYVAEDPSVRQRADELARETDPDAWQVLRDAMLAMKNDGVDWPSRIQAAKAALTIPTEGTPAAAGYDTVTLHVHRTAEGEEVITVTEGEQPEPDPADDDGPPQEPVFDPPLAAEG
jgi:hypothetical protein